MIEKFSAALVITGLVLYFQQSVIIDELNLEGDSLVFNLLIGYVFIAFITLFFSFKNKR